MLDKLSLNNEITRIKKEVLKARVQIIQKLIRGIKNSEKYSKGTPTPKNENKIKIARKEIEVLKVRFADLLDLHHK